MSPKILIIDYGLGNLHNVEKALRFIHADTKVITNPGDLQYADGIILPGVGAFGRGMKGLEESGFNEAIRDFTALGKPLLGICLGMQLLFSVGYEFGEHKGLGLVEGEVISLAFSKSGNNYKLPHIGWKELVGNNSLEAFKDPILNSIKKTDDFYFLHSFAVKPDNQAVILAYASYYCDLFPAVIKKDNIYGCQFHPEKSRDAGLAVLRNFMNVVSAQLSAV